LRAAIRRPLLDGWYVTWDGLTRDPATVRTSASCHEGRFRVNGAIADPVTWQTLARYGVVSRGPQPSDLNVYTDQDRLAAWTDANLDAYWRPLLARGKRMSTRQGWFTLTSYAAVWCVTGVSRLHYTLATGDIISKLGAGRYALDAFDERWRRVIGEALRLRQGARRRSAYRTPARRRRDVLDFTETVIADAHWLYAERGR
jgi:hypothetical protein